MEHERIESKALFIVSALVNEGFAIVKDVFGSEVIDGLIESSNKRLASGAFRQAGVGPQGKTQKLAGVRSDVISWIDESDLNSSEITLFEQMGSLRTALNAQLFLGLKNFEAHYARYVPGSFYQRHLDRFKSDDARTVSLVLYLNENWKNTDGGELRLYPENKAPFDVLPECGSLVCFMSDRIEHEVLPSPSRERLSIAAWFRR